LTTKPEAAVTPLDRGAPKGPYARRKTQQANYSRPRTRRDGYSSSEIQQLIDGFFWDEMRGTYRSAGGQVAADDGSYLQIRARMERTGDIDSEEFCRMIDLERAQAKLRDSHPIAALVMMAAYNGWTTQEIDATLRKLRQPAGRHLDKAIEYCRAYLSGEDAEAAFMRGSKPRDSTALKSA
jgi:hypothetical protein